MKFAGKEVQPADLLYVRRSSKAELAFVLRVAESMVEVAPLGATSGEGTSYAVTAGQIVARYPALGGNVALITPREQPIDLAPNMAAAVEKTQDRNAWREDFEPEPLRDAYGQPVAYRPRADLATVAVSIADPNRTAIRMTRPRPNAPSVSVAYDVVDGDHVNAHSGKRSRRVAYMTPEDAARFRATEPGSYVIGSEDLAVVVDE